MHVPRLEGISIEQAPEISDAADASATTSRPMTGKRLVIFRTFPVPTLGPSSAEACFLGKTQKTFESM